MHCKELEAKLPSEIIKPTLLKTADDEFIDNFLKARLPSSDLADIASALRKKFPITRERQVYQKRKKSKRWKKHPRLSGTLKRKLGLFKLDKNGMKFDDALPIHHLWVDYMKEYLPYLVTDNMDSEGNVLSGSLYHSIWKADFHGAFITVTKSKSPSLVGLSGILIFECKNVFKLVGKDNIIRIIPKLGCEFKMRVGAFEVSFLGKNMLLRPAERAKKFRSHIQYNI